MYVLIMLNFRCVENMFMFGLSVLCDTFATLVWFQSNKCETFFKKKVNKIRSYTNDVHVN